MEILSRSIRLLRFAKVNLSLLFCFWYSNSFYPKKYKFWMLCANTCTYFQRYVFNSIISRLVSRNRSVNIYKLSSELIFFLISKLHFLEEIFVSKLWSGCCNWSVWKFERCFCCLPTDLVTLFNGKQEG